MEDTTTIQTQPEENIRPVNQPEHSATQPSAVVGILLGSLIVAASIVYGSIRISQAILQNTPQESSGQVKAAGVAAVPDREGQPVLGSKNAPVTMVEFSDFQCPYCQRFFQETLPALKTKYIDTGKVRLVFRNFPLSFHVNAQAAAVAAECANVQGKFFAYHDLLFANAQPDGKNLDAVSLQKYARQLGLDMDSFKACLSDSRSTAAVNADASTGSSLGVNGTPTFFVNGTPLVGAQPEAEFENAIEQALKKS